MSCRTCSYSEQKLMSHGNGMWEKKYICMGKKEAPEVNPDDICEFYKDKFKEDKIVSCKSCIYCVTETCEMEHGPDQEFYKCTFYEGAPYIHANDICGNYSKRYGKFCGDCKYFKAEELYGIDGRVYDGTCENLKMNSDPTRPMAVHKTNSCYIGEEKMSCNANDICGNYSSGAPEIQNPPINDVVSHPSHYTEGRKYEPKDVIRDWGLNFNLGSAVKYISRAGRKDDIIQDLKKAKQFLDFEIDYLEGKR